MWAMLEVARCLIPWAAFIGARRLARVIAAAKALMDDSRRDSQRGVNRGISDSEVAYSTISQTIHPADSKNMRQSKNAMMPIVSLLFMLIFDDAGLLRMARVVPRAAKNSLYQNEHDGLLLRWAVIALCAVQEPADAAYTTEAVRNR
jgi:hypothetical protein